MHTLGNDFVVIQHTDPMCRPSLEMLRAMGDRHCGIGFDQCLLIAPSDAHATFHYHIFNADGQEVSQCGNGALSVAHYIRTMGLCQEKTFHLKTRAGQLDVHFDAEAMPVINMGVPHWMSPIQLEPPHGATLLTDPIDLGNPHIVYQVSSLASPRLRQDAEDIQAHHVFQANHGINVGFVVMDHPGQIQLRVFERGVGETLACGSGASAAVVAGVQKGLLRGSVRVVFRKGVLFVHWMGETAPVYLSGRPHVVYHGRWPLMEDP